MYLEGDPNYSTRVIYRLRKKKGSNFYLIFVVIYLVTLGYILAEFSQGIDNPNYGIKATLLAIFFATIFACITFLYLRFSPDKKKRRNK